MAAQPQPIQAQQSQPTQNASAVGQSGPMQENQQQVVLYSSNLSLPSTRNSVRR